MKKILILVGVIALASCRYDSFEECLLREQQKGGKSLEVTNYCFSEFPRELERRQLEQRTRDLMRQQQNNQPRIQESVPQQPRSRLEGYEDCLFDSSKCVNPNDSIIDR